MTQPDDDGRPGHQLVVSLAALLVVVLIVAGVTSVAALGAVRVLGFGSSSSAGPAAPPSLYMPSPSASPSPSGKSTGRAGSASTTGATPGDQRSGPQQRRAKRGFTLTASPSTVGPLQRINLAGRYDGPDGARLQVQREEGGWVDFPVDTAASAGQFATYIQSGRVGENRFRLVDESGRASRVVTVIIG